MNKLIFIHGGETFNTEAEYETYLKSLTIEPLETQEKPRKWKDDFFKFLLENKFEIFYPQMPCSENAKYKFWKIVFENILKSANEETIFVGHSLGASFLLQYFSEKQIGNFPQLHLVAPAFNINSGGFKHSNNFSKTKKQFKEIFIYHSQDDEIVPFEDSEKITNLLPEATFIKYKNRNHFFDERSPEIEKFLKM